MPDVQNLTDEQRKKLLGCVSGKNDAWKKAHDNAETVPADVNQKHFADCAESLGLEGYEIDVEALSASFAAPSDELKTENLYGREILSAGTWTSSSGAKRTYTEDDLDEMVSAYNELKTAGLAPYFKMDHSSDKEHRDFVGQPAIGWVANLRRVGSKILADFVKVPKKVGALIRAGTYRRLSPEVLSNFKNEATGKVYKNVISAVALLGAKHGAMTSLKDVLELFGIHDEATIADYLGASFCAAKGHAQDVDVFMAFEQVNPDERRDDMTEDEVKKLIADAVAPVEAKHAEFQANITGALGIEKDADALTAIKNLKADKEAKDKEIAERIKADFETAIDGVLLKAKADGKLIPANEGAIRLMVEGWKGQADKTGKFSFSLGDTKIEGTVPECLAKYFEAQPKVVNLDGELGGNALSKTRTFSTIPDDVARNQGIDGLPMRVIGIEQSEAVRKYARENKCDELTAFAAMSGGRLPAEPSPLSGAYYSIDERTGEMTVNKG